VIIDDLFIIVFCGRSIWLEWSVFTLVFAHIYSFF